MMSDEKIDANSVDEIVIVVPEEAVKDGELEIDLDELGIDVDELGDFFLFRLHVGNGVVLGCVHKLVTLSTW